MAVLFLYFNCHKQILYLFSSGYCDWFKIEELFCVCIPAEVIGAELSMLFHKCLFVVHTF